MLDRERGLILLRCTLGEEVRVLSQREYVQLYSALERHFAAEKLRHSPDEIDEALLCALGFPQEQAQRIDRLLNREARLDAYLAAAPEIQVLTRISPLFPQRLRRLGEECPPVLFCKGDLQALNGPWISVVGSRALLKEGESFAKKIGAMAAREGYVLVSGNAAGADRIAQEACLAAGGRVLSFLPDGLRKHSKRPSVLYVSDEGYDCSFTSARALRRNHFIHALGEKTFVAQCSRCQGGTWSGARDNLLRGLSPVFLPRDHSPGMRALEGLGGMVLAEDFQSLGELTAAQLSIFD